MKLFIGKFAHPTVTPELVLFLEKRAFTYAYDFYVGIVCSFHLKDYNNTIEL